METDIFPHLQEVWTQRVLIAVAHPDDESLWFGGLLAERLKRPHSNWFVYLNMDVPERMDGFSRVCEQAELERVDTLDGFDCIFTHNLKGEYGHIAHKRLHSRVVRAVSCPVVCPIYPEKGIPIDFDFKLSLLKNYDIDRRGLPLWQRMLKNRPGAHLEDFRFIR